jgi:large subunit ribosomal protein L30
MAARAPKKPSKKPKKKTLKVTLRRSVIGSSQKQRMIVRSLGLRRREQTVTHPDGPEVRGMLRKVSHLLDVEEEQQ